jgi:hypothetical protein
VDLYNPPSLGGAQIHDLNPGIEPDGLFWTVAIPDNGVDVNVGEGYASLEGTVNIDDYGTIQNGLFGGGPKPIPGRVSFRVVWTAGTGPAIEIDNDDDAANGGGFLASFFQSPNCSAQMEWRARVGNSLFVSHLGATSSSTFAEFGQEADGSFDFS